MSKVSELFVGDVIIFDEDDCKNLLGSSVGEYVVEQVSIQSDKFVSARKLKPDGLFARENPTVQFHLCPGYCNSLCSFEVVRQMIRIFV